MPTPLDIAQKIAAARSRCKTDIFFLADQLGYDFQLETHAELFACFPKLDPTKPWVEQQAVKDVMILWPRGHYKTTAAIVFVIYCILNFPNIRVLLMSGTVTVTTENLFFPILAHFSGEAQNSRFKELFPEYCGTKKELRAGSKRFTTCARTERQLGQGTVTVASAGSVKSGQHFTLGLFDDLVNDKTYQNPALLEKTLRSFTLAQALIDPGCYRIVTGTRYSFGDLYEKVLRWDSNKAGNWTISIKDCWTDGSVNLPDDQKKPRFPRFKKKNGELAGFDTDELLTMQGNDPANFACQYLNKPIHSSQQAYTPEMMDEACIAAQDTPPLSHSIMMLDLASGTSAHSDDRVITVGKIDTMGVGYLTDMRGGQWIPVDFASHIIDMVLRHRPMTIFYENTASGTYFASFLRLIAQQKAIYLPLQPLKVDNRDDAKTMRITALAGVIKKKRFRFLKGVPKYDKLKEQATRYPRNEYGHDDYIDTAALLYQELSKEMLSLPIKNVPRNAILALIADRENALVRTLTETEQQAQNVPDSTGLD